MTLAQNHICVGIAKGGIGALNPETARAYARRTLYSAAFIGRKRVITLDVMMKNEGDCRKFATM